MPGKKRKMPENLDFLAKNPARANELRENGILTDVTLVISEHEIKAHKIILALASDYFNSMFASGNSFLHKHTYIFMKNVVKDYSRSATIKVKIGGVFQSSPRFIFRGLFLNKVLSI